MKQIARLVVLRGGLAAILGSICMVHAAWDDNVIELDPYTVVGTRIQGIDLETTVPVEKLSIAEMDQTGFSQLGDVLRDLPVVMGDNYNGIDEGLNFIQGASTVNLRGLGAELVLIDGLRIPFHDGAGGLTTPYNLNIIPSSAIGSVEILLEGASAIYGSDAISGVINVRTIRNYIGTEIGLEVGKTEGTHSWEYEATLKHGQWLTDNTRVVVALDFFDRNNLRRSEHSFMESPNFLDRGGYNFSSNRTYPANFYVLDANHPLHRQLATYPATTDSPGVDALVRFPFPNQLYFENAGFDYGPWVDYRGDQRKSGAYLHLDTKLTENLTGLLDISFRHSWTQSSMAPAPYGSEGDFVIPAVNPYNPFGVNRDDGGSPMGLPYFFGRVVEAGPRVYDGDTYSPRIVAGLQGKVFSTWNWQLAGVWSESRTKSLQTNMIHSERFEEALNGVDLDGDSALSPTEYYNPFGPSSPAVIEYMRTDTLNEGRTELSMLDIHASGDIWEGDGFLLKGSIGGEFRGESLEFIPDPINEQGLVLGSVQWSRIHGSRDVQAIYEELHLGYQDLLDVQLAHRFENYSDFGDVNTPKVSASLRIVPEVLIRASYGEGFTAPSLPYLYNPQYEQFAFSMAMDPKRNEQLGSYRLTIGGNPNLKPSTSTNITFGFVLEPASRLSERAGLWKVFRGLTLGADFYDIEYRNLIGTPGAKWLLANEDELDIIYPDAEISIVRAPPLPGETYGTIVAINSTFVNKLDVRRKEYDLWMDWPISLDNYGELTLAANCTYTDSNTLDEEGSRYETIGWFGNRYRLTGRVSWSKGDWSTNLYYRYIDGIPEEPDYPGSAISGSHRINAQVSYAGWSNTRITIGVRNALNKDPSRDLLSESGFSKYHPSEKRFWYLRVTRTL